MMRTRFPEARWVGIADGAHSHWPWLEAQTTWQVVDFWHVAEYLAGAAKAMARGKNGVPPRKWTWTGHIALLV